MARMLQALKNLEAKSPPKPAATPKTPTSAAVVDRVSPSPTVDRLPPAPLVPGSAPDLPPVTESIDALAGHLANLAVAIEDPPGRFEWGGVTAKPVMPADAKPSANWGATSLTPAASSSRTTCEIERQVRRTLTDPLRAKPLVDLASRLRQDMQQTAAKTVAVCGISQSPTHESLLYVATLLVEQTAGRALLVDGDLKARALTEALEYGRDRGLAELLEDASSIQNAWQSTAVEKLMFLPAGLCQPPGPAATERWAKVLEQLSASFDCVLIDAGRTSDSAATHLARVADATYLVVQLGTVETSEAQKALADFRAAGARVLGCIAT